MANNCTRTHFAHMHQVCWLTIELCSAYHVKKPQATAISHFKQHNTISASVSVSVNVNVNVSVSVSSNTDKWQGHHQQVYQSLLW